MLSGCKFSSLEGWHVSDPPVFVQPKEHTKRDIWFDLPPQQTSQDQPPESPPKNPPPQDDSVLQESDSSEEMDSLEDDSETLDQQGQLPQQATQPSPTPTTQPNELNTPKASPKVDAAAKPKVTPLSSNKPSRASLKPSRTSSVRTVGQKRPSRQNSGIQVEDADTPKSPQKVRSAPLQKPVMPKSGTPKSGPPSSLPEKSPSQTGDTPATTPLDLPPE